MSRDPDHLMVVQFPHPGAEHRPRGSSMPWNRGEHARKFLKARGRYLVDGVARAGEFAFWGEWEPPSRVVATYPPVGACPRWLHEPYWERPRHRQLLQNTDPLVFGERFLYTNCRQRNGKLRHIAPGSLVLFGSNLEGEFVLDTVFVVGAAGEHFSRASAASIDASEWIRTVVYEPLAEGHGPPDEPFRRYEGRARAEAPDGPFSFVPGRPMTAWDETFARPAIRLDPHWLAPNLAMAAKATLATASEVGQVWHDVVDQVVGAGLVLGVELDAPPGGDVGQANER